MQKRALVEVGQALGYKAAEKLEGQAQLDREQQLRSPSCATKVSTCGLFGRWRS